MLYCIIYIVYYIYIFYVERANSKAYTHVALERPHNRASPVNAAKYPRRNAKNNNLIASVLASRGRPQASRCCPCPFCTYVMMLCTKIITYQQQSLFYAQNHYFMYKNNNFYIK